jgi:hypothetical protein
MKLSIILLITISSFAQVKVDTQQVYFTEYNRYIETNDCSVRALASSLNISYDNAYKELMDYRSVDGAIRYIDFLKILAHPKYNAEIIYVDHILSSEFIETHSKGNYLVFSKGHVFTLKYKINKWILFGNKNDYKKEIIIAIKLNKL